MEEIYITINTLNQILVENQLPDKLRLQSAIGISSISDLVEIIERQRKDFNDLTLQICNAYGQNSNNGYLVIAELDKDNLYKNLFDDDMWNSITDTHSNPLHMIRHLSLRKPDETVWWSESIYEEMISYYG